MASQVRDEQFQKGVAELIAELEQKLRNGAMPHGASKLNTD
jgi:hypothetical protein